MMRKNSSVGDLKPIRHKDEQNFKKKRKTSYNNNDLVVAKESSSTSEVHEFDAIKENTQLTTDSNKHEPYIMEKLQTPTESLQQTPRSCEINDHLGILFSNLYLDAAKRLCLDFPPRCAEDLAFCHKHHYRSPPPKEPSYVQMSNLRTSLEQQRYVSFVNSTIDMCYRKELPTLDIFTKLTEMLLSINLKTINNDILCQSYSKCIELFNLLVRSFPPCWHSLRPYYLNFFQQPLDFSKIAVINRNEFSKSKTVFEIILDLLEKTFELYTIDELSGNELQKEHSPNRQIHNDDLESKINSPDFSKFLISGDFEKYENRLQTFEAHSYGERLERLFVVLRLILQILENDFVMWMLHYHKKTKYWIFNRENRPLFIIVFGLSMYKRLTSAVSRIFKLFSIAISKGLRRKRIEIFERYIALMMVVSNTADMENSEMGAKYPCLGPETKKLIREFFKTFKAHNTTNIFAYLEAIDALRIPFVRYEFIDHFLQLFYFSHVEEMSPKKIAYDIAKKRWLRYKPKTELTSDGGGDYLSREQYLKLLLLALKEYCDWHGLKTILNIITNQKSIDSLKTSTDSVHCWPTRGSGVLILKKMSKDIQQLEKQIKMNVRMSKPKLDIPTVKICIDSDMISKYRNDLKFISNLHSTILKQKADHPEVDFSDWERYLNDFASK